MYQITTNESQAQIPEITQSLDELAREGSRRMIQAALELEVNQHIQAMRHLRTTNAIESAFSTVKARTKQTKGAGSRKAGLAMAFKLLLAAEKRWRRINAPHLVALVQAGAKFSDGQWQESEQEA